MSDKKEESEIYIPPESPLTYYGDKHLRKKLDDVVFPRDDLNNIAMSMFLVMHTTGGVGLSANQVGIDDRIAVIDTEHEPNNASQIILINPTITHYSEEIQEGGEGCLSIPGISAGRDRSLKIEVENYTLTGEKVTIKAEGFQARALQHEIDHLNGILFVDKLGTFEHNRIAIKLKRLARQTKKRKKVNK